MNPYLVLGVPRQAGDQQVRQAYLSAIKHATPETQPERFKRVVAAYEQVKDERSRHQYELNHRDCPENSPLDAFLQHLRIAPVPRPLSFEALKDLLRLCSKT